MFRALDRTRPPLIAGETIEVQVVVRNKGVGHTFPGGTNDSNEGWLEFSAATADGKPIMHSGFLQGDQRVDPRAHFYHSKIVDRHSNLVARRNAQDIYAPVYVNVIGPGTADVVRYKVEVPADAAGKSIKLKAKLNWRKFNRAYVEYVYADKGTVPDIPITTIESDEVELYVVASGTHREPPRDPLPDSEWVRFNDHGIGLLLKNDTRGAAQTFEELIRMSPARIDGYRNLARTYFTDRKLDQAFELLKKCETIKPGDPQTAWLWGQVLQRQGRYDKAAEALQRVLEYFPNDRDTWGMLGGTLFLDQQFERALAAYGNVLRIDPEDRNAHYHRMLCYRALGMEGQAKEAEIAYLKYQIDESAQEVTKEYRLRDGQAQFESQRIHVHE
ncbi:MAG: tetratricopeptide repeat protein [Planctomycetota bacterium]